MWLSVSHNRPETYYTVVTTAKFFISFNIYSYVEHFTCNAAMIAIKVARPFLLQGLQSFYRFSTALPSTSASYATTTINRPWKSNSEFSARVPTDQVIPFHVLDDGYVNRNVVMEASYRFDDVLDVDRLRLALHRLMQRDGWKKLGARIRQNASSQSGVPSIPLHFVDRI